MPNTTSTHTILPTIQEGIITKITIQYYGCIENELEANVIHLIC